MINIVGDIFGTTGYASHTRSLANALCKKEKCRLSTGLIQNWNMLVNDAELEMISTPSELNETNIIVATPAYWKMFLGTGINCGYCVWEGDKVPESWIDEFLNPRIDYIFVPSQHTYDAILNTIPNKDCGHEEILKYTTMVDKIRIIQHGVDRTIFYSQRKKDKFDCSNEICLESRSQGGEDNIKEHMPLVADTHADNIIK